MLDSSTRPPSQNGAEPAPKPVSRRSLARYAWLSIAAAIATILLKGIAYWVTGSIGLLSDAAESFVNLVGGLMALAMLTVAERPADEDHAYGHSKAEYFSSGVEGTLIFLAAVSIAVAAGERLVHPRPLQQVGVGLVVSVLASLVNLFVALVLLKVGRKAKSITLEANAYHLLTDVWTSVGVVAGVGMVALTNWVRLDPILAMLVAANIVWTAIHIVRRSVAGLMDVALPPEDVTQVQRVLENYSRTGVQFHALRTRQAGARRFISMHVLVPGEWTVHEGHRLLERVESDVRRVLPNTSVFTHLESLDDPASWEDQNLERNFEVPERPATST